MSEETFDQAERELQFIATQANDLELQPEFVRETLNKVNCRAAKQAKQEVLLQLVPAIVEYFPELAKFLQSVFGKDKVQVYKVIKIENEDSTIYTEENTRVFKDDLFKVKLEGEEFWVIAKDAVGENIIGVIYDELKNTEVHGAKKGDEVLFQHKHIFDYKPADKDQPIEKMKCQFSGKEVSMEEYLNNPCGDDCPCQDIKDDAFESPIHGKTIPTEEDFDTSSDEECTAPRA